ncbi:hypothetical protein PoB_000639000 [Plakobranchus ocellatus]|uniref:Uncharacterized protein n=1 Tax=Plakobranchus ocellatus TaxID=259542 RepID=A0AAV3YBL2_9GAST|nr:hypothetical protein PoB_000639000 [Plakobranchus ocellatus]
MEIQTKDAHGFCPSLGFKGINYGLGSIYDSIFNRAHNAISGIYDSEYHSPGYRWCSKPIQVNISETPKSSQAGFPGACYIAGPNQSPKRAKYEIYCAKH